MIATKTQTSYLAFEGNPPQGKNPAEMSLEAITAELDSLAPHIGHLQAKIAAEQAHLQLAQERARHLLRAAKANNAAYKAPQGFLITEKVDVHLVGGPSYIEHMLRDWRELTIGALEINPAKLHEKVAPFIVEGQDGLEFMQGMNQLPIMPRKIEVIEFDYQHLASLPLPQPQIVIKPEEISDPLNEELSKKSAALGQP